VPCDYPHFTLVRATSSLSWRDSHSGRHSALDQVRIASTSPSSYHSSKLTAILCYRRISERYDKVFATGCLPVEEVPPDYKRANAAFVVLARNKELEGVVQSLKSIERHFNRWYHYPYVFLNDGDFDDDFKATVKNYTSAPVEFGKIDETMWGFPDWVDHEVAKEGIRKQGDAAIMYGGMESYHHMCRFYSG
jgi:mannosyltransferase